METLIPRAAWAEIDLRRAAENIDAIIRKAGRASGILGVIKADGYGHGAVEMAKVLRSRGVSSFGVGTLEEAVSLREAGILDEEIVLLGLIPEEGAPLCLRYGLTPVISSYRAAAAFSRAASACGQDVFCSGFLALDSGMGRIGYLPEDPATLPEIRKIAALPRFRIKGLFSHFAEADAPDKAFTLLQQKRIEDFSRQLSEQGIPIPPVTAANSAAFLDLPSSHYQLARPGILLYGCYPSPFVNRSEVPLSPIMSVKASIVHLKRVPAGFSVSYGRAFTTSRESLIATLPLGYADGLPRPYSSAGKAIVRGRIVPLAGTICMDQCMLDVTDVPGVSPGDTAILMGSDGRLRITAEDIAAATGTINYEILCAFGQRLPRRYLR